MARGHLHGKHSNANHGQIARSLERRAPAATDDSAAGIPDSCKTQTGVYRSPTPSQKIDALSPVRLEWDSACLPTHDYVDIYLYASGRDQTRVFWWEKVPSRKALSKDAKEGKEGTTSLVSYDATIKPFWWNNVQPQELSIKIVGHQQPLFLSPLPAGPSFVAEWTAPTGDSPEDKAKLLMLDDTQINVGTERVTGDSSSTGGKTAAGVIVPLLVIALTVLGFFKWKRMQSQKKRKDWAEQVDKRMSTISTDWKSVSVAGAQAAIRNSMAVNGRSSFSFGNIRPASTATGGEYNEKDGGYGAEGVAKDQRRPGVGLRNPSGLGGDRVTSTATRVSRVSFADQTRPSMDSARRTKTFRDSYVPPVPTLPNNNTRRPSLEDESADGTTTSGSMSPTQTQGALTLTPEDIRARIAAGRARADSRAKAQAAGERKTSFERDVTEDYEVMPALQMMRTDHNDDEYLLSQGIVPPTPPAATYPKPITPAAPSTQRPTNTGDLATTTPMSPVMNGAMPMLPATVMSPDDMLRAYAERKKMGHMSIGGVSTATSGLSMASPQGISYPSVPQPTAGGRTLFGGTLSPTTTGNSEPSLGFAPGEYDANFSFAGVGAGKGGVGFGHAQQQSVSQAQYQQYSNGAYNHQQQYGHKSSQSTYSVGDAYGGYDAAYGGAEYAIGDVEEEDVTSAAVGKKAGKR